MRIKGKVVVYGGKNRDFVCLGVFNWVEGEKEIRCSWAGEKTMFIVSEGGV